MAAACGACSSDDGPGTTAPFADASVTVDGGGQATELVFETCVIDGLNTESIVGDNAVVALDSTGRPHVAYGIVPSGTSDRLIRLATKTGACPAWSTEDVVDPGANNSGGDLVGLGFTFVNDVPHIVYIGGDNDGDQFDTVSDLMLSTRTGGQWSEQTLADTSDQAVGVCPFVQDYCNRGGVVGTHPAIAAQGQSYVVAYRDNHFGFGADDIRRADVEAVASGLGFDRSVVDPGRSGGAYTDVALTTDGRPVVAYNLEAPEPPEDRVGVWAAVWRNGDWVLRKLSDAQTTSRTSVAAGANALYVAFFDSIGDDMVLATSTDDGDTWTTETIEVGGKVGLHPSLALDAQGRPVVAYTFCGDSAERRCPTRLIGQSEVRLARRRGDGWTISRVDDGLVPAGFFNSLAIGPDGTIYVAYQDANNDLVVAEASP